MPHWLLICISYVAGLISQWVGGQLMARAFTPAGYGTFEYGMTVFALIVWAVGGFALAYSALTRTKLDAIFMAKGFALTAAFLAVSMLVIWQGMMTPREIVIPALGLHFGLVLALMLKRAA